MISYEFIKDNLDAIKKALPNFYTHIANINFDDLKELLDEKDDEKMVDHLLFFEEIGLIIRDDYSIKVNSKFSME
ncbi:hypothetical protein N9043_00200 [bacterium]|nr:hypothetical protein [bacterium]